MHGPGRGITTLIWNIRDQSHTQTFLFFDVNPSVKKKRLEKKEKRRGYRFFFVSVGGFPWCMQ